MIIHFCMFPFHSYSLSFLHLLPPLSFTLFTFIVVLVTFSLILHFRHSFHSRSGLGRSVGGWARRVRPRCGNPVREVPGGHMQSSRVLCTLSVTIVYVPLRVALLLPTLHARST